MVWFQEKSDFWLLRIKVADPLVPVGPVEVRGRSEPRILEPPKELVPEKGLISNFFELWLGNYTYFRGGSRKL